MLALACVSANQEYSLRLIRINGDVIRQIDPPDGRSRMDDPAFSPDGKFLGFWAGPADGPDGGTLYTVPTAGGTPEPLLKGTEQQTTGTDADMVYSPDGRYVAFTRRLPTASSRSQADIFRARTDGRDVVRLTNDTDSNQQDPTWSPSGGEIAFASNAHTSAWPDEDIARIWTMTIDGTAQHVLWTENATRPQGAAAWTAR